MAEKNKILEQYKLILTTQSPVFIGDGGKLNKKEYIRQGQNIQVPNKHKMYHTLIQKRLIDKYEDYMLSSERADLGEWLKKQRISPNEYKSWIDYSLVCDLDTSRRGQIDMMTFIKDPYGNPYIPGSSLKGALRTALLVYLMNQHTGEFDGLRGELQKEARRQRLDSKVSRTRYLASTAKDIETQVLNKLDRKGADKPEDRRKPQDVKDAVNDMMACILISDSKPLKASDLIMCQKMDMNENGVAKNLNLARECIKPGVKIEFDVTIDNREGFREAGRCPFDQETLLAAIKYFATQYFKNFFKPFKQLNKIDGTVTANMIWLGGGAGYVSKTVTYPMLGKEAGLKTVSDIMQKTVRDERHHHENDEARGVSPHMVKCTKYGSKIYEFGRCQVQLVKQEI